MWKSKWKSIISDNKNINLSRFIMELEDFFYTNPDQFDPNFQSKIYAKKEFNTLTSTDPIHENKTKQGYFFYQEYAHRYMLAYDYLIFIWEAGAGKTIGALGAAERFRSYRNEIKNKSYPEVYYQPAHTYIKRAIILVKNQNLKGVFEDTLIRVMHQHTGFSRPKDIRNDGFYNIYTYTEFYNFIKSLVDNIGETNADKLDKRQIKIIENEFMDTIFIIDEAHTFSRATLSKKTNKKSNKKINKKTLTYAKLYQAVHNIIKISPNIKVMFLTATPMINDIMEAIYLINLLIAKYPYQLPTSRNDYLYSGKKGEELSLDIKMSPKKLAQYLKGIISYTGVHYVGVKFIESGSNLNVDVTDEIIAKGRSQKYFDSRITHKVKYQEDLSDIYEDYKPTEEIIDTFETSVIVDKCYMSGLQLEAYIIERDNKGERDDEDDIDDEKEKDDESEKDDENEIDDGEEIDDENEDEENVRKKYRSTLHVKSRHILNFVFPDPVNINNPPLFGESAINIYKKYKLLEKQNNTIVFGPKFLKLYIPDGKKDNIQQLSCSFKRAFDIIEDHLENKYGVIYVFFDLVVSGAMIFESLARAKFNFERYVYNDQQEGLRKQALRLTYLTGDSKNIKKTLDRVSEARNWNGDYIKLVIGSKATSVSYSISNVTTIIQMEPDWNFGQSYQAIRRGIRKDGYDNLKEKIKDGTIKGPINVNIYKLCVLIPIKTNKKDENKIDSSTVDSARYNLGLEKDWKIKRIEHSLRTAAIDCEANRKINIDPKTKNYSREALYDISNYICDGAVISPTPNNKLKLSNVSMKEYDTTSSWILLYSDEYYKEVETMVLEELKKKNIIQSTELITKTINIVDDEGIAINILDKMLKNQVVGTDRYGFNKYISETNGYFYLGDYLLEQQDNYNDIIYNINPTFSYTQKLGDYFDRIIRPEIINNILGWDDEQYHNEFKTGGLITKTIIFEDALKKYANKIIEGGNMNDIAPRYKKLLLELNDYYIVINRPLSLIEHVGDRMFDRVIGEKHRGQRPQNKFNDELYWILDDTGEDWIKIKEKDSKYSETGDLIFIHYSIIFTASAPTAGRGVKRFRDRLRILEHPYQEWKTIDSENTPVEQQTYENIIADNLENLEKIYKEEIMNISMIDGKKVYGPGWFFDKNSYSKTPLKEPLEAVYLTENPFTKKIRIMAPEWFREKYSEKKSKLGTKKDKRKEASGRELKTGFGTADLRIIYLYFRPEDKNIIINKETYEKDIITILSNLGLITKMHN